MTANPTTPATPAAPAAAAAPGAAPAPGARPKLRDFLRIMVKENASDLILKTNGCPAVRVAGVIRFLGDTPLPSDLMRSFAGDPIQCFATVTEQGKPIAASDVKEGNEGIGPLAGDAIDATYALPKGATGYFASHRGAGGNPSRFGLQILGTKGIVFIPSGYLIPAFFLKDGSWSPGASSGMRAAAARWQNRETSGNATIPTAINCAIACTDVLTATYRVRSIRRAARVS